MHSLKVKSGLKGSPIIPGDKSISHRSIIIPSISNGVTEVKNYLNSDDVINTLNAFSLMGVKIIKERKSEALDYEEYLKRIAELAKKVHEGDSENLPESINTAGLKVLYNNLDENEELAVSLHENLKNNAPDGWREHSPSQNRVKGLIFEIVNDTDLVERLYQLIEHQMEY